MAETTATTTARPALWLRADTLWLLAVLLCTLYFALLKLSACPWQSAPFAFVAGCFNHGIDWNRFMAPLGAVVICLLTPLATVYWLLRLPQLGWQLVKRWRQQGQQKPPNQGQQA